MTVTFINPLIHTGLSTRQLKYTLTLNGVYAIHAIYTVNHKKLGHVYFYCNFGKCWSIFKILSLSESERNGS